MNKKEMKTHYESKTLGEVRGIYSERDRVLNYMIQSVKDHSQKIIDLDPASRNYVSNLKDYADHIKGYSRDIAEETTFLSLLRPILDKKELEGINETAYENYMKHNVESIKILTEKVKEMEQEAQKNWDKEEWSEKAIKNVHWIMLRELIIMLKDHVGDIVKIKKLEYNGHRGMDGIIEGTKSTVSINTILAGGYNIQKLHYRTLIQKY